MMEVNALLFMLLWESVLVLSAVGMVILLRTVLRRRRERAAIDKLVAKVKAEAQQRKEQTRNLLEKKYGYSGEQLDKTAAKITHEEKRLYQTLANLFINRDSVAMENLSINFEEAVEPYRTLEVPSSPPREEDEKGADDSAEIERLREQNQLLSDEMHVTMNILGKMLNEYSALAGGAGDAGPDGEKPEDAPQEEHAGTAAEESIEIVPAAPETASEAPAGPPPAEDPVGPAAETSGTGPSETAPETLNEEPPGEIEEESAIGFLDDAADEAPEQAPADPPEPEAAGMPETGPDQPADEKTGPSGQD